MTNSDSMLAAVIEASLDCVIVAGEDGLVREFNLAAEQAFGHTRSDAIGRSVGDLIVPEHHRAAHGHGWDRYMAGGAPRMIGRRIETEALHADGHVFPVELTITESRVDDMRLFVASIRDLTEVQALRGEMKVQEAVLAGFMQHAPVGMYVKDAKSGTYVMANPEMEVTAGYSPERLVGRTARDFYADDEVAVIEAEDRRVLETRKVHRIVEHLADVDNEWTLIVRFPIDGADGKPLIGGIEVDITPQKRAEEELQRSREALHQAERMTALGSLLAGISHELNNPLAIVVGEAALLQEDAQGTEFGESAERIYRAAERCSRITQSFLAMARQRPATKNACSLNAMVKDTLDLTEYGLRSNDISLTLTLDPELPPILADVDQLQQVVANLIVNAQQALQASPAPRRILIESFHHDDKACLRVADNGPGVPRDIAPRIFDPFFTTKPEGTGTGIGLSFSQGMVEAHGGTLSLETTDAGASFLICLPLAEPGAEASEPDAAVAPHADLTGGHALIVDDEYELGNALGRLLAREGFTFDQAIDGEEAVRRIEEGDYDLILSDLRMPRRDGPGLHDWIAAHRPKLLPRLAFITGDALGPAAVTFLEKSGRPHIVKPFTRENVSGLLETLAGATR
ncbi:hybrid sensor histidine kinase/response regulator [Sphingomicrobium flavum]|uniref:hybrid sensor histidine kinase/response regulator n=1 Tax=Sphingomicrobium flavum TaxID=1229164 RepID=UPI0021ADB8CB|nr:PAS domain S-box protein [Sphingomicrobium flavum]